jgi:hypothetical protein
MVELVAAQALMHQVVDQEAAVVVVGLLLAVMEIHQIHLHHKEITAAMEQERHTQEVVEVEQDKLGFLLQATQQELVVMD